VSALDALLLRVAAGDQAAFADWYDATSTMVFGMVLRVLRDRAQAEEVVQEVYVEAWRLASRFDPARGSSLAWLNTMAHRRAVDRVRSAQRTLQRDALAAIDDPPGPDPSDVAMQHDECRRARDAVEKLSTVQREVIELAYFQGHTHHEIAALLDIPLGTAKTRIRDALRHLRRHLEEAT